MNNVIRLLTNVFRRRLLQRFHKLMDDFCGIEEAVFESRYKNEPVINRELVNRLANYHEDLGEVRFLNKKYRLVMRGESASAHSKTCKVFVSPNSYFGKELCDWILLVDYVLYEKNQEELINSSTSFIQLKKDVGNTFRIDLGQLYFLTYLPHFHYKGLCNRYEALTDNCSFYHLLHNSITQQTILSALCLTKIFNLDEQHHLALVSRDPKRTNGLHSKLLPRISSFNLSSFLLYSVLLVLGSEYLGVREFVRTIFFPRVVGTRNCQRSAIDVDPPNPESVGSIPEMSNEDEILAARIEVALKAEEKHG